MQHTALHALTDNFYRLHQGPKSGTCIYNVVTVVLPKPCGLLESGGLRSPKIRSSGSRLWQDARGARQCVLEEK